MTRIIRTLLIAITMIVSYVTVFAQQIFHEQLAEIEAKHFVQELAFSDAVTEKIEFSKETFSNETMTLPYRKATIPGYGDKASLVIYLHGGSSKGDDNETQMQNQASKPLPYGCLRTTVRPSCSYRNVLRIRHGLALPKIFWKLYSKHI